ncbi:MAG: PAS domain S-box protein [Marinilabiliaceae bacterium]|nr:PAS domain S-box protein [Marinilabiliaceae bacterium]
MKNETLKIISIYLLVSFFWFFSVELLITQWVYLSKNSVVYELIADGLFIGLTTLVIFRIWRQTHNLCQYKVQTLESYQQEYDQVIENSLDAIFFIENETIIKCNESTLCLFGCSREEIIGQHPYHFSPVNQPEGQNSYEVAGGFVDAALAGEPQFFKWQHFKLDGTPFDAEVALSASRLMGKKVVQAIVRDVTEQSSVRAKLLQTEIKYREIFNAIRDSILIIDPVHEKVIEANRTACERYGICAKEEVNTYLTDFFPANLLEKVPVMKDELQKRDTLMQEVRMKSIHGEELPIEISVKQINYDGRDLIISVGRDISERKRFQKRIFNAVIEAEEKERSRMAKELHDGVSPIMSAVKLYVQSIWDCQDNELRQTILEKVGSTIDEAITSLSEISNNLSPHVLENFGLVIALKSFIEKIEDAQKIKFNVSTNFDHRLPVNIEVTLYRVIVELINNSFKYSGATKVTIRLLLKEGVHLIYSDNGVGFDVAKVKEEKRGMGLFNMTNRIQSLTGEIEVASQVGQGVVVKAFIPLK